MALDIRSHDFGRMDPPPESAVQAAKLVPLLFGKEPGLLPMLREAILVFVFRRPAIELWEIRGAAPSAPIDDVVRAVASFGAPADAVLVPFFLIRKDAQGRRLGGDLRFVAECRRRRAELVITFDAAGEPRSSKEPRKLGKVARGWIGVPPPPELRLEAIGPVGVRHEPRDA